MTEIAGYTDRLTVFPGERLRVMVSTSETTFDADLVRLIHGDENPEGPGPKADLVDVGIAGTYPGRVQTTHPGSFAVVASSPALDGLTSFTAGVWLWPTRPARGERQGLIAKRGGQDGPGFSLGIDGEGHLELRLAAEGADDVVLRSGEPLKTRHWAYACATWDARTGVATLDLTSPSWPRQDLHETTDAGSCLPAAAGSPLLFAALSSRRVRGRLVGEGCYDGKLEAPVLLAWAAGEGERAALAEGGHPAGALGAWAFEDEPSTDRIYDRSTYGHHGLLVQMPARAMVGHNWDGQVDVRIAPEQYGAIHFHVDDLEDAGWEPDLEIALPDDLPSGVYAVRCRVPDDCDQITFFVAPREPSPEVDTAILFPTVSYLAYANERMLDHPKLQEPGWLGLPIVRDRGDEILLRHSEYGGSLYDSHLDGSGNCYSSALRPVLNMRPDHRNWQTHAPRALSSDLYIVDWLEQQGVQHHILTDHLLHDRGVELLRPYRVVITGTHPEYWTGPMRDALERWLDEGGRLMYLGGNGFYWVTSIDPTRPHVVEVRRGIAGTRTWESAAGELRHSTTLEPGGLWRYRGRDPNRLVGNGFAAQGFDVPSPGYKLLPAVEDPRVSWIVEGVEAEVIGEYGLILGGVAGDEIDRFDLRWGSPPHAVVIATSQGRHSEFMQLVSEDVPVTNPNVRGNLSDDIRADLVFMETASGGAVFSVGSMAWTGALSHGGYDNDVSRVTLNVLRRFRSPETFELPPLSSAALTEAA
jgi:N,N-dimethylformamidase